MKIKARLQGCGVKDLVIWSVENPGCDLQQLLAKVSFFFFFFCWSCICGLKTRSEHVSALSTCSAGSYLTDAHIRLRLLLAFWEWKQMSLRWTHVFSGPRHTTAARHNKPRRCLLWDDSWASILVSFDCLIYMPSELIIVRQPCPGVAFGLAIVWGELQEEPHWLPTARSSSSASSGLYSLWTQDRVVRGWVDTDCLR